MSICKSKKSCFCRILKQHMTALMIKEFYKTYCQRCLSEKFKTMFLYWTIMNLCRNAYSSFTCTMNRKWEKSIIVAGKISMTMLLFSRILLLRIMPSMTDDTLRRIVTYIVAWIPGVINIIIHVGCVRHGFEIIT